MTLRQSERTNESDWDLLYDELNSWNPIIGLKVEDQIRRAKQDFERKTGETLHPAQMEVALKDISCSDPPLSEYLDENASQLRKIQVETPYSPSITKLDVLGD